jgi:membrane protease YdiL (CAAX protease family)
VKDEPELAPEERGSGHLAIGYLAALPLFIAYEYGLGASVGGAHNAAELIACRALSVFGTHEDLVRRTLLGLAALAAFVHLRLREVEIGRHTLGTFLRGLLASLALGPLLLLLLRLFDVPPVQVTAYPAPGSGPPLELAAFLAGGSAWEELVFRVGCYGALYLVLLRLLGFFGVPALVGRFTADVFGLVGSSLLFAAMHLEPFLRWLGLGGERFDPTVFLWRVLAGLCLGVLFRWRGFGVSAWAHGLFNLALALGAGPGVFQAGS